MIKRYLHIDDWRIIEKGFHPDKQRASESIFALGNGRMGQRGHFEETYSSDSLQGSYLAGISFLDRTKVGWWKNGYPKFFARVPNAPDWSSIRLRLIDEELDLAVWDVDSYERTLDMKNGVATRVMEVTSPKGHQLHITIHHVLHMMEPDLCMIRMEVESINYTGKVSLIPYLNADVTHETSNYNEPMWNILRTEALVDHAYLWVQTRRERTQVCMSMGYEATCNGKPIPGGIQIEKEKQVGFSTGEYVKPGERIVLTKYAVITSSLYGHRTNLVDSSVAKLKKLMARGWDDLLHEHARYWSRIWYDTDVVIEGDPEAQQGIRFNIFQLHQSYQGRDSRLNIGAKGFTGEKYGGNTFWNTELCCLPYFMLSSRQYIAKNLLLYREQHLAKAISNAQTLGFKDGAALYPMVTINGEECHNEWEVTFEEVHRNSIIAYAIIQYVDTVGDTDYLLPEGFRVLVAICRFWAQRVSWADRHQKYMILGVTGPNEYENNVDNNWYTNFSAKQILLRTVSLLQEAAKNSPEAYESLCFETNYKLEEGDNWQHIANNMYEPYDKEWGIYLQQDGYQNKIMQTVDEIPEEELPINQHWSWDRILRSCFIKQSDVLLGMYLYREHFDLETVRRHYEFYAPKTVHESSLSLFVHCIIAARIGKIDEAYKHFMHATRLDLDDYNQEVHDGLHVTSMPGSWLALVHGFAGMHVRDRQLCFEPVLPGHWKKTQFTVNYLEHTLRVSIGQKQMSFELLDSDPIRVYVNNQEVNCIKGEVATVDY